MSKVTKLLLVAAFFNALSWMILIPVWQYPDEQAHFAQVQDLAELGFVPNTGPDTSLEITLSEKVLGTERDGFGNNKYTYHPEYNIEYSDNLTGLLEREISNLPRSSRTDLVKRESTHNPPLYYIWTSIFYRAFYKSDLLTRVYATRLASLLLFLPMIYISSRIGQLIFSKSKILPLVLTSFVAFKPMLVFVSTGVLPDVLTNLLFSTIIFLSLIVIRDGVNPRLLLITAIIIILGVLTRQQFLIVLPILAAAIMFKVIIERKLKIFLTFTALIGGLFSLGLIFPYLNYLPTLNLPEVGRPDITLLFSKDFVTYLKPFLSETNNQTFAWYWGVYRWLSLTLPPFVYQVIRIIILISVAGIVLKILKDLLKKKVKSNINFYFLIVASLIYASVILIWDYYFRLNYNYPFGIQGRYFFPLITAHMTIILVGLLQLFKLLFKSYDKYALLLTVILIIIFNNLSLFHIASYYYDTSSLHTFIMQASQYKPLFLKGNTILIILTIAITLQMVFVFQFAKYVSKTYESFKGNRL